MALRARLVAPPPPPETAWPWHSVKWGSIAASTLLMGDRRMEGETYLSSGYGLRIAIEAKPQGWKLLGDLARVWMPGRLKGIQVSREFGTPFLAATQVFDVRPIPRKWLSLDRTEDAANRFVRAGMILVTCSGSVGHPTLAYAPHENTLISHDLLRIEPSDPRHHGWIYAYLHASQTRAMAIGAHYGHIIKHLETSHVDALPIPVVDDEREAYFNRQVKRILELRNEGHRLTLHAEAKFEEALGPLKVKDWGEHGYTIRASNDDGCGVQNRRRGSSVCDLNPRCDVDVVSAKTRDTRHGVGECLVHPIVPRRAGAVEGRAVIRISVPVIFHRHAA